MPKFKVRRPILATGGFTSGGGFLFGTSNITAPSAATDATVTASVAITGVADGDTLLVTPITTASAASNVLLQSACAVSGGVSASFVNAASTDSASGVFTLQYIVFS